MKNFLESLQESNRQRRAVREARCQEELARQQAALEHQRQMELKHGWPPAGAGANTVAVMGSGYSRSNGGGIAMAALFLSVAIVAVGFLGALVMGEPR